MTAAPVLTRADVDALYQLPLLELVFRAAAVHQQHFKLGEVQLSQLLSIKTGGCAENCGYCSQSAHFDTGLEASKLMALSEVVTAAKAAKAGGADRFCMGAAWRELKDRDLPQIEAMVRAVKDLGLETCVTLGMLNAGQAERLKAAGLDYYNHNLDSSPEYYGEVVTTRVYQDRLDTLEAVRQAGVSVCCGGILGLGEDVSDRVGLLHALATLPEAPQSVPINALVPIPGTPLGDRVLAEGGLDPFELVRAVATARILMPRSVVRLSAGRESLSEALQALCFLAGANSIFIGARLLTTPNPEPGTDAALFRRLGLTPLQTQTPAPENAEVEDKVFEYLR